MMQQDAGASASGDKSDLIGAAINKVINQNSGHYLLEVQSTRVAQAMAAAASQPAAVQSVSTNGSQCPSDCAWCTAFCS